MCLRFKHLFHPVPSHFVFQEHPTLCPLSICHSFRIRGWGTAGGVSLELPGARNFCRLVWCLISSVSCVLLLSGGVSLELPGVRRLCRPTGGRRRLIWWLLVSSIWCMVSGVYCLVSAGQQEGDGGGVGNIAEQSSRNTSSELQIVKK